MLANSIKNALNLSKARRFEYVRIAINHSPNIHNRFQLFSTNLNDQSKDSNNEPETESTEQQTNLLEENKKLLDTVKDLDDKYKRALAETENTRIRMRKQMEDAKIYAIQGFCKDLLDVADVFNTAIESVPKEKVEGNSDFKNLFDGVIMTEQQLQAVFRRHGLVSLNPLGIKFNPNEHHALFEVEAEDKEPGTVSVVTKIGYKLHDRTIRPAMVGVVKSK
ncbi:hypothetical protein RDWZM_001498 [Blomia tropicalis]|uniref:GrpE protein homolog n=1 Tax=Blomia tropicalis TaxID=40697 RepID=A0A9Q0RP06_BLOTA|nr:hypothetical protein RDWZM_001498 [Blomia tropicalis]